MVRKILVSVLIFVLLPLVVFAGTLKVFFLDVGEGEAIYIETPNNKKVLIDTGNLITGYKVVKFLKNRNVNKLDILIITHPHPDHMGGIFHVLQYLKVNTCYDNGQSLSQENNNSIFRWYQELFRTKNYRVLRASDKILLGKVSINILSPEKFTSNWNENSLVIKITYGLTSFLLMGDANINIERELLKKGINLKADVLKVGHHGANDASSKEFIEAVSPKYAVISINKHNIRGYPSEKVIERLKGMGIEVFFTYRDGDILFESDGKNVIIKFLSNFIQEMN